MNSPVVKSHGATDYLGFSNSLSVCSKIVKANLIEKIKLAYYDAGKKSNSKVAPVGIAYEMAYKERPKIMLHHPDGTHPGLLGTYLGSCVVFSMITNSSPEGLKYNYLDQISDDDLLFLQKVAWNAYLEHKKQYN